MNLWRYTLLMIVSFLSCTDAELCRFPCAGQEAPPPDDAITVDGQFCTLDPTAVVYPYKVLFVIDVSGSNTESDPNDDRARAVRDVIDAYIENRSVSFGAITFNTQAEAQTPGFTRNFELLVPDVVDAMRNKAEGTNYIDTLNLVYEFIEQDILATAEGQRARTRYDVQWLSDGIPDPCQRPEPVRELAARVIELRDQYGLFDLVINTTQLTFPNDFVYDVPGCNEFLPGPDYLSPMAEVGTGQFRQLDGGSLAFTIGFDEIRRRWESRSFFVVNRSRQIWDDRLVADSDRDGVRDDDSVHEPDPLDPDADDDGCSDRVSEEILPNVGLCDLACRVDVSPTLIDTDGDTLPDCAEKVLGYHRTRIDSDLDGFADNVELRFRTNPLDPDVFQEDADGDGVSDGDEIREGTNPRWPESPEARRALAFRYGQLNPVPTSVPGVNCFQFSIDNVRLAETASTSVTQRGDNELCVHVVQTVLDDPDAQPEVTVACKTARYLRDGAVDYRVPGTGVLRIEPGDFRPLASAGLGETRGGGQ